MKIIIIATALLLTSCTTSQVKKTVKTIGALSGGVAERGQLLDSSANQELDYEFSKCMIGKEQSAEQISLCTQQVYQIVRDRKELDHTPENNGKVIVEQVSDQVIEAESFEELNNEQTNDEQDRSENKDK